MRCQRRATMWTQQKSHRDDWFTSSEVCEDVQWIQKVFRPLQQTSCFSSEFGKSIKMTMRSKNQTKIKVSTRSCVSVHQHQELLRDWEEENQVEKWRRRSTAPEIVHLLFSTHVPLGCLCCVKVEECNTTSHTMFVLCSWWVIVWWLMLLARWRSCCRWSVAARIHTIIISSSNSKYLFTGLRLTYCVRAMVITGCVLILHIILELSASLNFLAQFNSQWLSKCLWCHDTHDTSQHESFVFNGIKQVSWHQ